MVHKLTQNFECLVPQDGTRFMVRNTLLNAAKGYSFGEYARFIDGGAEYRVTVLDGNKVKLQKLG